jgi:hypothetical protein
MLDRAVTVFLWTCTIGVWLLCLSIIYVPWITGALYLVGFIK